MIVPGMFVCSSFLISVCMFIVSKALLISSATVIVRAGGSIWLNPFATVLFNVSSSSLSPNRSSNSCCVRRASVSQVSSGSSSSDDDSPESCHR